MPWSKTHKPQTRERILEAASRLFTHHGFDSVSIDNITESAGLTRGAFYAHFASKSDLYTQAIHYAARQGVAKRNSGCDLHAQIGHYLSEEHLEGEDFQCPLACLISDVAQQDEQVRAAYTQLFGGFVEHFCSASSSSGPARQQALQQAVAMIGGMAIARTLTDQALAVELLDACRELAESLAPGTSNAAGKRINVGMEHKLAGMESGTSL